MFADYVEIMHQTDPAIPKSVERARAVVHRQMSLRVGAIAYSVLVAAGTFTLLGVVGSGPMWDPNPWYALIQYAGLFVGTVGVGFALYKAPSREEGADARSILETWKETRSQWAKEVVAAEMSAVSGDVKAHARAEAALDRMRRSSAQHVASGAPKQR